MIKCTYIPTDNVKLLVLYSMKNRIEYNRIEEVLYIKYLPITLNDFLIPTFSKI